jgi:hypothetical protein
MKGKDRCKILKDIRKRIAEENDIEFITSECKHKGDCLGTCPKCESELRYLEKELESRRRLGKTVTVAGLALSVTLATSSCISDLFSQTTEGDMAPPQSSAELFSEASDGELMGVPAASTPGLMGETEPVLMGDVPPPTETIAGELVPIPGEIPEESETVAETPVEPMGAIEF